MTPFTAMPATLLRISSNYDPDLGMGVCGTPYRITYDMRFFVLVMRSNNPACPSVDPASVSSTDEV